MLPAIQSLLFSCAEMRQRAGRRVFGRNRLLGAARTSRVDSRAYRARPRSSVDRAAAF